MHRQRLSRSLRLGIDQRSSSTTIVGMFDIEDLVDEIAVHPGECAQSSSTRSQTRIQKHEELIAELELGHYQRPLFCRQFQRRLFTLGTDPDACAWAWFSAASNLYCGRNRVVAAEF